MPGQRGDHEMSKTAIDAMLPYLDTWYGNASSLYAFGQKSAEALAAARETVAGCLGAEAREITFTSGGGGRTTRPFLRGGHWREEGPKTHHFHGV